MAGSFSFGGYVVLLLGAVMALQVVADTIIYSNDTASVPIVSTGNLPYAPDRARCILRSSRCYKKIITCPQECRKREPQGKGQAACYIDCVTKCEPYCKHRKPNCYGDGALCYDPRFVGGDGVMFYFHGQTGRDFCIVSDHNVHINAHFIGKRPPGRARDYTWVQALGIMFASHSFTVAAKKVGTWDDQIDQIVLTYDGTPYYLPEGFGARWASEDAGVRVERTDDTNAVEIVVDRVMSVTVQVVPITEKDNKLHNYQLTADDCFAHLDLQFKFFDISATVNGVLGQTYQPTFKSPVKRNIAMPVMGGDKNFLSSSLLSNDCKANQFKVVSADSSALEANDSILKTVNAECSSTATGRGMVCRR